MSKPALTINIFGAYLGVLGIALACVPNFMLTIVGMAVTSEVWIRVVGVLIINMGIYYLAMAKSEVVAMFRASVYARILVLVAFCLFSVLGISSPTLILFGLIDFTGGMWTFFALRNDRMATQPSRG